MTTIIEYRLKALDSITLQRGPHAPNDDKQFCAMEAAAWIAGEPHSDQPECVSPVLGAYVRALNDALDDEPRQALKPYIAPMIGTAGDGHDEERAWIAVDWLVRVCAPAWLDLGGLNDSAEALRSLPPVTEATVNEAQATMREAREKAAAARAADAGAARAAARAADWATAWAAVRDAARAGAAARAVAARAGAAARDAATVAAGERIRALKAELHRSAYELLERMIDGPFGEENA